MVVTAHGFAMPVKEAFCAVAEAASLAEPGASGAGLAIGLGAGAAARDRAG